MQVRNGLISLISPRGRSGMLRLSLVLLAFAFPVFAQVNGAIYTSTPTGTTVNGNIYDAKTSVYLNGGPQNLSDPGLRPDGLYYFQVTDPSSKILLSADDISCRQVVVSGGRIVGVPNGPAPASCPSGFHPLGTFDSANGEMPVQLCPPTASPRSDNLNAKGDFDAANWCDNTPNHGGEYKAWVTPVSSYDAKNCSNYGFCDSASKTDNFKVRTSNSAYITVCKFNDLDGDGVQDSSDPFIPGWPITATGVDTSSGTIDTVTAQTDSTGCISFSVSDFTGKSKGQVTISEGTLAGAWYQAAPVAGTYSVADGGGGNGTLMVTVAPQNTQSLTVKAGESVTLANFGNTCLDSSCGGNAVELTVTENANPSLTRTYAWGITKSVDASTVYSVGGGASTPANYTVTLTHNNGTDSAWQVTGTIKITNPSWIALGGVDVTDSVSNGGICTVTNGSAITIPAKSEVDLPYTCNYSSFPANGTSTATVVWNSGYTTPGNAVATSPVTFASPAIKIVDGSVTVTDKLDSNAAATLGTASSSTASPITYTYYRTFTDPAGTCTSHTNKAAFTTNTTLATGSAGATTQDCQVSPPSGSCVVINAVQGVAITPVTMVASGGVGGPYTFSATGLPAGLIMATNGTISGIPTVSGTFSYTVSVTDKNGNKGTVKCSVTVAPPSVSATCVVINAVKGVAITPVTMVASGGAGGPYIFSAAGLPAGLTMASNGTISGTPTVSGTFSYTVTVTDKSGTKGTVKCSITVAGSVTLACAANSAGKVGVWFKAQMTASGGVGPYTYSVATGTLPAGLSLDTSTGVISGNPTAIGSFTVKVTDSKGNVATATCPITINRGDTTGEIACWNTTFAYGYDYSCDANNDSGIFSGYMTYSYDGGAPVTVQMNASGHALFLIHLPVVGRHTVVVSYPAQGNYNGYTLPVNTFTVTSAATKMALTPSAYYAPSKTSITFSVSLISWSAGTPKSIGSVSFYDGTTLLGTNAVNANGQASYSTAALSAGYHTIKAVYSGGGNFASATGSATIQIAK
jgi:hypothetical protein